MATKKKKKKGTAAVPMNSLLSFFEKKGDTPVPAPAPAPASVPLHVPTNASHTPHSQRWGWPGSASVFAPLSSKKNKLVGKSPGAKKKRGLQKGNKAQTSAAANLARASTVAKRKNSSAGTPLSIPALSKKRKRRGPDPYRPEENSIRDCTATEGNHQRMMGNRAIRQFAARDKNQAASDSARAYKAKLKLARAGSVAFGPLDLLLFQQKAEARFGDLLPDLLKDVPSSAGMLAHCKPVLGIVFAFVVKCFEEYEITIASLRKKVRELKNSSSVVHGPAVDTIPCWEAYGSRKTLWRHANSVRGIIRSHSGQCDVKAITLAHEVVKLLSAPTRAETEIERKVNEAIVEAVQGFYYELKERHQGRYPKLVRSAWLSMNAVLGGVKDIPLTEVAAAVGVDVKHLYKGKKTWTAFVEGAPLEIEPHLTDRHGNAWPIEWVEFVQAMWLHETVTRQGEGDGDYSRNPKDKRGEGGLHHVHWLETPQYVVQEKYRKLRS